MGRKLTRCGIDCTTCPHFGEQCRGCDDEAGRVYWVNYVGAEVCPVFQCAGERKLADCGGCAELPCKIWIEMKDPEWTDEQHQESIRIRVAALKNR